MWNFANSTYDCLWTHKTHMAELNFIFTSEDMLKILPLIFPKIVMGLLMNGPHELSTSFVSQSYYISQSSVEKVKTVKGIGIENHKIWGKMT